MGLVLNSALKKGTAYLIGEAVGVFSFQNLRPGAREMARLWESGRRKPRAIEGMQMMK